MYCTYLKVTVIYQGNARTLALETLTKMGTNIDYQLLKPPK
jgi:hypothetical protein